MPKSWRGLLPALPLILAAPAQAQTTNCQWFGAVWTCNATPAPAPAAGTDWSIPQRNNAFQDSLRQGMELGERARQAQLERERLEAETELYRAQAQAVRDGAATNYAPAPQPQPAVPAQPAYLEQWFAAAQPRMGLYPDFQSVVFAPDVTITPDMVMLMTSSPFAADIAYYLATHKAEALAISQLPLLDAARAIDRIEGEIKQKEGLVTKPQDTEPTP